MDMPDGSPSSRERKTTAPPPERVPQAGASIATIRTLGIAAPRRDGGVVAGARVSILDSMRELSRTANAMAAASQQETRGQSNKMLKAISPPRQMGGEIDGDANIVICGWLLRNRNGAS